VTRLKLWSALVVSAAVLVPSTAAHAAQPRPGWWVMKGSDGHGKTMKANFVITKSGGENHKFPVEHGVACEYYLVGSGEFSTAGGRLSWRTNLANLSGKFSSATKARGSETFNYKACKGHLFHWTAVWRGKSPPVMHNFTYITADFTWTQDPGTTTLHFTDTTKDPKHYSKAWHWTFGDGTASDEHNPGHTYASAGDYTVKLVITWIDPNGETHKEDQRIPIPVDPPSSG
jgi:PKD repeat protein